MRDATRSARAVSTQASTTNSATRAPSNETGSCVARVRLLRPGLRAEDELAFLVEEDACPRATAVLDERSDNVAKNVVGVATVGDDPVDRFQGRDRAHASVPSNARIRSRKRSGTGSDRRSLTSSQTSVCFAVTISSSGPSSLSLYAAWS